MDWFFAGLWVRLGWIVAEIGSFIAAVLIVSAAVGLLSLPRIMRRMGCKHARFHETMACEAVCLDCGKNLGFIGKVRDRGKGPPKINSEGLRAAAREGHQRVSSVASIIRRDEP